MAKKIEAPKIVVGIGASAGGLDAIQKLFEQLPEDSGMAFVIVQHLSPDFVSLMPEWLTKHTKMPIHTAKTGLKIKRNNIYLNQRNHDLFIKDNKLQLSDRVKRNELNLPIDKFFHSLGENYQEKSVAIVLSGTGSDGSRGISTLKEGGGFVFVQDPFEAGFDEMPNSAIRTQMVDRVEDVQGIAKSLIQLCANDFKLTEPVETSNSALDDVFHEVLESQGMDFRNYRKSTILRRLERRMTLNNVTSLDKYLDMLQTSPEEVKILQKDFLIGVTNFFRDKEPFRVLAEKVIPDLCHNAKDNRLKLWVPACSTGEEVYSIAILLDDYIRKNKLHLNFKVFATDIDEEAIRKAREGVYSTNAMADIPSEFLKHYFIKSDHEIKIISRIREKIIFSTHDLLHNPPFIRMDFVSCRNFLIYLEKKQQLQVIEKLLFALKLDGVLFIGNSESLDKYDIYFSAYTAASKIFKKTASPSTLSMGAMGITRKFDYEGAPKSLKNRADDSFPELLFYKAIAKGFNPSVIFLDADLNILFSQGKSLNRISFNDGVFQKNFLKSVDSETADIVKRGVEQVNKTNKNLAISGLKAAEDKSKVFELTISKVSEEGMRDVFMLDFGLAQLNSEVKLNYNREEISGDVTLKMERLETKLKETEFELQTAIEALETSNEELQASNEELMASNEELQSTNEELRSVNEELYTINAEFVHKNAELVNISELLTNLLNGTQIATLFLDKELNIIRFTPSIKDTFNLTKNDIGRPLATFVSQFQDDIRLDILENCKKALDNNVTEKVIRTKEGSVYHKRILPFLSLDNTIEGVVLTFTNMDALEKAKLELESANQRLRLAVELDELAVWAWNAQEDTIEEANEFWDKLYGFDRKLPIGKQWTERLVTNPDKVWGTMYRHFEGESDSYEITYEMKEASSNSTVWHRSVGKVVSFDKEGKPLVVMGVTSDITLIKRNQLQLQQALEDLQEVNRHLSQFSYAASHDLQEPLRTVSSFTNLLVDENQGKLTDDSETYIDFILEATERMKALINDMLEFSRAGKSAKLENVDLNLVLKKSLMNLDNLIKSKDPSIKIGKMPRVEGVESELISLFENLISNGIKFQKDNAKAKVNITARKLKDSYKIKVEDNGIGIEGEYFEKIFQPFKRLHNREEYEGSGIGLSICTRVVKSHGGKIWLESKPNKGTTFIIELPIEQNRT